MNVSRNIQSAFWTDDKVAEFNTEDKIFFLYLLTNDHTKQVGVYKVSPRQMAYESGLSADVIERLMRRFENEYELIQYDSASREICILNWGKFNFKKGGKPVEDLIKKELREVTRLDFAEKVAQKIPSDKVRMAVLNHIETELTNRPTNRGTNREEIATTTETTNRGTNRHTNRSEVDNYFSSAIQEEEETLIQSDLTNRGTNRHTNREEEKTAKKSKRNTNTQSLTDLEEEPVSPDVIAAIEAWKDKKGSRTKNTLGEVDFLVEEYGFENFMKALEDTKGIPSVTILKEQLRAMPK